MNDTIREEVDIRTDIHAGDDGGGALGSGSFTAPGGGSFGTGH